MTKGQRREREAREIYERAGYWMYSPQNPMYGDNDLWNLFDLAGFNPRYGELRFVQVKSNGARGIKKWVHQAYHFAELEAVEVDFVVPYDNQGWRLVRPNTSNGHPLGFTTVYDERGEDVNMGDGLAAFLIEEVRR